MTDTIMNFIKNIFLWGVLLSGVLFGIISFIIRINSLRQFSSRKKKENIVIELDHYDDNEEESNK